MLAVMSSSVVSSGTAVLWIKNLSLQAISGGGSLKACIMTAVTYNSINPKALTELTTKVTYSVRNHLNLATPSGADTFSL